MEQQNSHFTEIIILEIVNHNQNCLSLEKETKLSQKKCNYKIKETQTIPIYHNLSNKD